MKRVALSALVTVMAIRSSAQQKSTDPVEVWVKKLEPKTIAWRRDFHQNPELGNREVRTAKIIADHLRSLGIEVKEGVGKTGVVGILKGGKPGPVIGLRADIDALPVTERVAIPFASKVKTTYNGQEVGVMHACGHDTHTAMLMTAAEMLAGMKNELAGTVKFVFQPAEEGAPAGEEGGAALMIKEGVLENPKVEAMFGLHINAQTPVGQIKYREQGMMAESDWFTIKIKGKQSHGAQPWLGIDPVAIGAQIINGLQTIVSRQSDLTKNAVVISTTVFKGGVRENIIPEEATLAGTIRTLDKDMRNEVWERIERTAKNIAEASGATAEVIIEAKTGVTYNDPKLTRAMLPSLQKVTNNNAIEMNAVMGAEDFSFFSEKIPSLYLYVGGMPANKDAKTTAAHHTPDFFIDESGMQTGVKALIQLVMDYPKAYKKIMKHLLILLTLVLMQVQVFAQRTDKKLQQQIEALIKGFNGDIGVYVKDLRNGKIVSINADTVYPTASVVKVPILVGIMDKINRGELTYHQPLVYRDSLLYAGVDILGSFKHDEKIELSKVMMLMLTMSDNTASLWLQSLAGTGTRINQLMDSLGFVYTKVNSRTPGREATRSLYGWGQSSPRETATLFEKIYKREVISTAASDRMLRILNRNYYDGEAISELPPNAVVYSKSGAVNQTRNEVLLVKGDKAEYVFCVMTKNNKDESWKNENEAWVLTRKISGLLWNYYEPKSKWQRAADADKFD